MVHPRLGEGCPDPKKCAWRLLREKGKILCECHGLDGKHVVLSHQIDDRGAHACGHSVVVDDRKNTGLDVDRDLSARFFQNAERLVQPAVEAFSGLLREETHGPVDRHAVRQDVGGGAPRNLPEGNEPVFHGRTVLGCRVLGCDHTPSRQYERIHAGLGHSRVTALAEHLDVYLRGAGHDGSGREEDLPSWERTSQM